MMEENIGGGRGEDDRMEGEGREDDCKGRGREGKEEKKIRRIGRV